jgi:hypothetical protein
MLNFDQLSLTYFQLAELVAIGLPADLRAMVDNFELLLKEPFDYKYFEQHLGLLYKNRQKPSNRSRPSGTGTTTENTPTASKPSQEETVWQIHAFLDSQGQFHWCKKTCGSTHGFCLAPIDRYFIQIPPSFKAPLKPPNYQAPKAWGTSTSTAGKPTQPPAGRPPGKLAAVAGVEEPNICPELDEASIAALAAIDKELCRMGEEEYVTPPHLSTTRVIIELTCLNTRLRGLVDTGSELNLILTSAASRANLLLLPLTHPTSVRLALDNESPETILSHYVTTSLRDLVSGRVFKDVTLKVGPITGAHDMILGTPFLSTFHISVSVSQHSINCDTPSYSISDYRKTHAMNKSHIHQSASVDQAPYPCKESEQAILNEFANLFLADIPAVAEDLDGEDKITKSTFPAKLQDKASRVRHKIILTDPAAIVNEKQYPYP